MQPSDLFFAGTRYAIMGYHATGRSHGPIVVRALIHAGKHPVIIGATPNAPRHASVRDTLHAAGAVDGVVLLPPTPWNDLAAAYVTECAQACVNAGVDAVWLYTAGDPEPAAAILREHDLDPVVGVCPCLYIPNGGFPHNLHRWFHKRFSRTE